MELFEISQITYTLLDQYLSLARNSTCYLGSIPHPRFHIPRWSLFDAPQISRSRPVPILFLVRNVPRKQNGVGRLQALRPAVFTLDTMIEKTSRGTYSQGIKYCPAERVMHCCTGSFIAMFRLFFTDRKLHQTPFRHNLRRRRGFPISSAKHCQLYGSFCVKLVFHFFGILVVITVGCQKSNLSNFFLGG